MKRQSKNSNKGSNKGQLFVITGPSGVGKSTIIKAIMQRMDNLAYSVSHTTRRPRKGEIDGRDYYFVDKNRFQRMINNGEFVEWARVYSDFYGTSYSSLEEKLMDGTDVILDLDTQGALNIRKYFKNSTLIFVLVSSLEELKRRLIKRGTDEEILKERISQVQNEIRVAKVYDYIVINEILEIAIKEMESIIISERIRTVKRLYYINSLLGDSP